MRKVLYVLGVLFIVLVLGIGTLVGVTVYKGAGLDKESARYVDDAVIAITAHWNKDELLSRASPEFKKISSRDQLASIFDAVSGALGPLVDYEGAKGDAMIKTMVGSGTTITAVYKAQAKYQKGSAEITLTLIKIDDAWMIQGFHVGSNQVIDTVFGRGT
jgi:hypothetical protein